MALNRDAFLSFAPVLPREEVPLPELGGSVWVRTLTASERDQLELDWEQSHRKHFRARLAVAVCCDEAGVDLFQLTDIPVVGAKPTTVLTRIADVAFRLNRFTKDDVEDLEKNSRSGQPEGSSSGSPRSSVAPSPSSGNASPPPSSPNGQPLTDSTASRTPTSSRG